MSRIPLSSYANKSFKINGDRGFKSKHHFVDRKSGIKSYLMKTIIQQNLSTTEIIIDRNHCNLGYQHLKFKYLFTKSNFY